MALREDKEFREFQNLMAPPPAGEFKEGFNWGSVCMALFVGFIMAPASMYMSLVAGLGMGSAAQWVTLLLFIEISRRALRKVSNPEVYILFYMCGAAMSMGGDGWLWRQFIVQSEEIRKMGLTPYIPAWWAPSDPAVLAQRTFFHQAWMVPVGITSLMMLLSRFDAFGLGYVMYRLTADVERLPFPMAPVGAAGITALTDSTQDKGTWRVKVFSAGAALGIAFGALYLGVPTITGAYLAKPITLLPIPFVDLTPFTEKFLPAMPCMASFDLSLVITGMVLPFWAVIGSVFGMLTTFLSNPLLHHWGVLHSWKPGTGVVSMMQANTLDFYFSFGIGLTFAMALISFLHLRQKMKAQRAQRTETGAINIDWSRLFHPPAGRGDIPLWVGVLIYLVSTSTYITLAYLLVNKWSGPLLGPPFPLWLLIFYGFVYTPVISYVSARMEGIVGGQIGIPMIQQATFILSGYKGAAIWFAPIPLSNYASQTVSFRTMELTGCRFRSLIKAEALTYPIVLVGTFIFAGFIWSLGPVPSNMFPYANQFWELNAYNSGLMWSATLPGEAASPFREAFRWEYLSAGLGVGMSLFTLFSHFNLPVFFVYGAIGGFGQSLPHAVLPMLAGALLGHTLCRRWFGDLWPHYRIVFAAGFGAGIGLITMLSLGVVFMKHSASVLPL
ncbi:MAG: peptide transporter [bacterium]